MDKYVSAEVGVRRRITVSPVWHAQIRDARLDLICLALLLLVTAFAGWRLIGNGVLVGQDAATQFYPWYAYLGERLRDLSLPSWNPAQFSGAPFLADPQSGWTYVPAMVLFTLLPLALAIPTFLMFHLALAGLGSFALARALGIGPAGALMTGIAYELSGPVFSRSVCCTAQLQVVSWVPILLLGAEMAINRDAWRSRLAWIALTAFALSQIYATWLGQGSYYAVLLLSGFVVYRVFIDPSRLSRVWRAKLGLASGLLGGVAVISIGLAAAGIIPRFEYNQVSNLAGGVYSGDSAYAAVSGGWDAGQTAFREMAEKPYYMGGVVVALATISVILSRARFATPFFATIVLAGFALSSANETVLHRMTYAVLPRFEDLHRHWPERLSLIVFIAFAALAGAAVDALPGWLGRRRPLLGMTLLILVVALAFVVGLQFGNDALPRVVLVGVAIVAVALLILAFSRSSATLRLVVPAIILLATLDLISANAAMLRNGPYGGYHAVDVQSYYEAGGAARYLQYRSEDEAFRYFGYDPQRVKSHDGWNVNYRFQFNHLYARIYDVAVNNRATMYGIDDVQGYNPVQYQPYVDFMDEINGAPQDYHDANVQSSGVRSPLLDVLNARFIIMPSAVPPDSEMLYEPVVSAYQTVFDDGKVRVLERDSALPRAWMVHEAREVSTEAARDLVNSGVVDPGRTALLNGDIPAMEPAPPGTDLVTITEQEPEYMRLETTTTSDGLLIVSEIDYPNWVAYVDGEPVEHLTAFGLVRAVPVEAGSHTIEFRYESTTERIGFAISLLTLLLVGGVLVGIRVWGTRSGPVKGHDNTQTEHVGQVDTRRSV